VRTVKPVYIIFHISVKAGKMSDTEQSTSDEDVVYKGPVRPYLFEPIAEPVADAGGKVKAQESNGTPNVGDLSAW
jgi:hypothetical protein